MSDTAVDLYEKKNVLNIQRKLCFHQIIARKKKHFRLLCI